ncbi:putative cytokinetic ring protein SteA [Corynebacterium sp. HS2168-gen11]|uniref:putative cytokinetic ring protein SteA n=1 Tax=Corynebacterium sp. HS2168-gen11 TaxID=2974027 RepID=UPI00216B440E|nr:putative cytokinetic ring protein SteA [Corynebacterium sp. HS2168-gen11]MCS4535028.1 putative cytokinetic ring protein SteA [Corynebacterium sp. HS2168-gen11]
MASMSLFSRSADLPGTHGVIRDLTTPTSKGHKRLSAGDIAVIDAADISRAFAQRLLETRPAVVINSSRFSTGVIPNYGPQMLFDAGIILVEAVTGEIWQVLKDGKKARLTEEGELYYGSTLIGQGTVLTADSIEQTFVDAQQHLVVHMEAYFGNAIQFIHTEAPLFIDGLGVPDVAETLRDRKVIVVSDGAGYRDQIRLLRNFIREYEPAIIAVEAAADTLVEAGYTPDFIVGNPVNIGAEALRCGAKVILPADPDGHAVGLERIQDLGVGAMTFPAALESPTDLALLLAGFHDAELVVNVGAPFDLDALFAQADSASPSALLCRAKLGAKLVDASAISALYSYRSAAGFGWLWSVLGVMVLIATVVVIAGFVGDGSFVNNLIDTWNSIALRFQSLFT